MTVIDVYNLQAEKSSRMELNDDIFGVPVRKDILHQVVVSQLNNRRSGSASTKSRSEVNRSGRKLWRQKGTGRARAGDAASPTRRGGGVIFGPTPRRYIKKVTKKLKRAALFMALTDKVKSERLFVVEDFNLPEIKTRNLVQIMKNFEADKALIVIEEKNENLEKSSQNIPRIKVMRYQGLNVYDVLKYNHLFLSRSVIPKIEEALIS
jgi:large subunit ribosomal protein L4